VEIKTMEGGAAFFSKKLQTAVILDGKINGQSFQIKGSGTLNANTGTLEGKYVCETGKLPVSWTAIVHCLQYGYLCGAKYPGGITDFFKSTFPDGYIQERTLTFENDGVLKTHQTLTIKDGTLTNTVTLTGEGFKTDGNVMKRNLYAPYPSQSPIYGDGNGGVRSEISRVWPLKDGGHQKANMVTHARPIRDGTGKEPKYHFIRADNQVLTDASEPRDHIVVKEILEAYDFKML